MAPCLAGRERVERALAFGASRHEAGKVIVKLGVRAALQRLMQHTGGPGLLLLPALAAGLLLAGVPPTLVSYHRNAMQCVRSWQMSCSCRTLQNLNMHAFSSQ